MDPLQTFHYQRLRCPSTWRVIQDGAFMLTVLLFTFLRAAFGGDPERLLFRRP